MNRSAADCLVLFDTSVEGRLSGGWASGVLTQRTKTVKAGPMLYMDCYPIWNTKTYRAAKTEAEQERHRKAQAKLNKRNAEAKLTRLLDENFCRYDLSVTLKYNDGESPEDERQALKDVQNYIKRIKYLRNKRGLTPIRYIYVIEETNGARGHRFHAHVVMSGDGITMDEAEKTWTGHIKGYTNMGKVMPGTDEQRPNLAHLAHYMLDDTKIERTMEKDGKNPQKRAMKRMWNCSKNLRDPDDYATTADKKISVRKVQKIAETMNDLEQAEAIFAKLYPDYKLVLKETKDGEIRPDIEAKRSRWTTGIYVRAVLRRKEKRPPGGGKNGEKQAPCRTRRI